MMNGEIEDPVLSSDRPWFPLFMKRERPPCLTSQKVGLPRTASTSDVALVKFYTLDGAGAVGGAPSVHSPFPPPYTHSLSYSPSVVNHENVAANHELHLARVDQPEADVPSVPVEVNQSWNLKNKRSNSEMRGTPGFQDGGSRVARGHGITRRGTAGREGTAAHDMILFSCGRQLS